MLPPPTVTFTIPSIEDNVVIQCRVYHPASLAPTSVSQISEWRKRAAIVAHPYAPLGGSYDDPVVDLIAATILKQGFIVGTFNFRGAGTSKGRTSWQSKAEQNDYVSFIAFMLYYLHHLKPPALPIGFPKPARSNPELRDLSPVPSQVLPPPHLREPLSVSSNRSVSANFLSTNISGDEQPQTRLLIAGYSYGALIATYLPPIVSSLLSPFQNPVVGSPHAEIRLRAEGLASQQSEVIHSQVKWLLQNTAPQPHKRGRSLHMQDGDLSNPKIRKTSGSVRMGGEEDLRRASHDSYRPRNSFTIETPERVRKSINRVRSIARSQNRAHPRRQGSHDSILSYKSLKKGSDSSLEHITPPTTGKGNEKEEESNPSLQPIPDVTEGFKPAYLLISPPVGWLSSLITFSKPIGLGWKDSENDVKLTVDPTLVMFGTDDSFVNVRRYRGWVERLEGMDGNGGFRWREVEHAGHFWHDGEACRTLRGEVEGFVRSL